MAEIGSITGSAQQQSLAISKQNLSRDDFLKLFVCQLKQQDPMEPVKNTELITQMSQLTSMEFLQDLNTKLEYLVGMQQLAWEREDLSFSANLLGRQIEAINPENGQVIKGKVLGFYQGKEGIWLQLEEKTVPLYWVNKVFTADEDVKVSDR
ncbi:MAG: flagellar hook capping FlgD N-terminal domain-containing protein [Syntrophaceticus sp.]